MYIELARHIIKLFTDSSYHPSVYIVLNLFAVTRFTPEFELRRKLSRLVCGDTDQDNLTI